MGGQGCAFWKHGFSRLGFFSWGLWGGARENVFIMVNNYWFLLLFLTCLWLYKPAPIKASRIGRESEKRSIFSIYVHICRGNLNRIQTHVAYSLWKAYKLCNSYFISFQLRHPFACFKLCPSWFIFKIIYGTCAFNQITILLPKKTRCTELFLL